MTLTFAELKQAASGLTDADMLLTVLGCPAFWAVAFLSLVVLIGSRFAKASTKVQNALAVVVLAFVAIGATLALPVSGAWVAQHGELAKKSAEYLQWQRTDAATFNRFEVLTMKRDLAHDVEVGETVLAGVVKKGGVAKDAEPAVMAAMAMLHKAGPKADGLGKAIADANAEAAKEAAKQPAGAPVAEKPAGAPVAEKSAPAASTPAKAEAK